MRQAQLTSLDLPDFGSPTTEPALGPDLYAARLKQLLARMAVQGLDALVIYGDREHVANISWATGHDPRFEEAICIIVPGRTPTLLAGNEGYLYAEIADGNFERVLWQPLSLMGQPRDKYRELGSVLRDAGVKKDMRIGLAGWKGFETEAGVFDPHWFETPHYLVETLKTFGPVTNAALLFMHPTDGLRVTNEIEQLAREMAGLGAVPSGQSESVLDEFNQIAVAAQSSPDSPVTWVCRSMNPGRSVASPRSMT